MIMIMINTKRISDRWRQMVGDEPVLLMVSGGVDSMALMETAMLSGIKFSVLHVTHDMRCEAETDTDMFVVSSYCDKHGITMFHKTIKSDTKTETDYRNKRVDCILDIVNKHGFKYVATGHHADDQLETVLMRIFRGCGINGLSGIKYVAPYPTSNPKFTYVRPLLCVSKKDLIGICRDRGVAWVEDQTNKDDSILRNNIRNNLIPVIREVFPYNYPPIQALTKNAEEATEYINNQVDKYIKQYNLAKNGYEFDKKNLLNQGDYFLRHFLIKIYVDVISTSGVDSLTRNRMVEFIKLLKTDKSNNKVVELNGCKFKITKNTISLV